MSSDSERRLETNLGPGAAASLHLSSTDIDAIGEPNEQSRLLSDGAEGHPHNRKANAILVYLVILLYTCGTTLQIVPRLQRYEEIVCGELYDSGPGKGVSQSLDCKGNAVQEELLLLLGGEKFFGIVPAILVVIAVILHADVDVANRCGRGKVLAFALFGIALSQAWVIVICTRVFPLPMYLIWTQCLLQLIGGGPYIVGSMLHLLALGAKHKRIRDVGESSSKSTAKETGSTYSRWLAPWNSDTKSAVLFKYHSTFIAGTAVGQFASSFLVRKGCNIWYPWAFGEMFVIVGALVALLLLPETIVENSTIQPSSSEAQALDNDGVSPATPKIDARVRYQEVLAKVKSLWKKTISFVKKNHQAMLLISMSFLGNLGYEALTMEFLLPYISKRYHQDFSSAGLFPTFGQISQFILFLIGLPIATYTFQTGFGFSSRATGYGLALASCFALAFGALCLGLAPNVFLAITGHIVMSSGTGFMILVSSLVITSFSPGKATIVYYITSILAVIANGLAGLMYSKLISVGLRHEYGLSYVVAACVLFLACLITILATVSNTPNDDQEI